jgi:hypothetical protein
VKVSSHLEARVRIGRGIPHSKDSLSLLIVQHSKDTCVKKKTDKTFNNTHAQRGEEDRHNAAGVVSLIIYFSMSNIKESFIA